MRDWNGECEKCGTRDNVNLKPTYEGLKLIVNTAVRFLGVQFKAYLWGIETWHRWQQNCIYQDLKPTYEGLKPRLSPDVSYCVVNLKPTYEGLKLKEVIPPIIGRPHLKPTYEGLKPLTPVLTATCGFYLKPTNEGLKHATQTRQVGVISPI